MYLEWILKNSQWNRCLLLKELIIVFLPSFQCANLKPTKGVLSGPLTTVNGPHWRLLGETSLRMRMGWAISEVLKSCIFFFLAWRTTEDQKARKRGNAMTWILEKKRVWEREGDGRSTQWIQRGRKKSKWDWSRDGSMMESHQERETTVLEKKFEKSKMNPLNIMQHASVFVL